MNRDNERLDRLMGLLASEASRGSDLRAGVMQQLLRRGAVRTSGSVWRAAACMMVLVGGWMAFEVWNTGQNAVDLGTVGRRAAEWILPTDAPVQAQPIRYTPRIRHHPEVATAPWPKA